MKIQLLSISAGILSAASSFAGGPLAPSTPPGVIWKTLNEIEPRTPISSLPFTITSPGSYYVGTNNLTGTSGNSGITISANNVTLDLMGFTLTGGGGSISGITVPAAQNNVTIRNGNFVNWPGWGINASNASYCKISQINVSSNASGGLIVGAGSLIDHCNACSNTASGIVAGDNAVLNNCTSTHNTANAGAGISVGNCCSVSASVADFNLPTNLTIPFDIMTGISLGNNSVIKDCSTISNNFGIGTGTGCRVKDCIANNNLTDAGIVGGTGIGVGDYSLVSGCEAFNNSYTGIQCGNSCAILDNNCLLNQVDDLIVTGTANTVIRNVIDPVNGIYVPGANNLIGISETSSSSMNSDKNPHVNFASP